MKRHLLLVLLVGLAGFVIGRFTSPSPAVAAPGSKNTSTTKKTPTKKSSGGGTWAVVNISDGDMFDLKYKPTKPVQMRARLLNVDTPNRGQDGHKEAREALAQMIYGKHIRIEFEKPGTPGQTRSGLLLCYAFIDGKCVNVELVRQGISKFQTRYGEGRLAAQFKKAEEQAKAAKRGVWAKAME